MRNTCFHIEYSPSDLSAMAQGKPLSCSLDFQFHPDTAEFTKLLVKLASRLILIESDRVVYCFGKLLCISNE